MSVRGKTKPKGVPNRRPMLTDQVARGLPKLIEHLDIPLKALDDKELRDAALWLQKMSDYANSEEYWEKRRKHAEYKAEYDQRQREAEGREKAREHDKSQARTQR